MIRVFDSGFDKSLENDARKCLRMTLLQNFSLEMRSLKYISILKSRNINIIVKYKL